MNRPFLHHCRRALIAVLLMSSGVLYGEAAAVSHVIRGLDHEALFGIRAVDGGLIAVGSGGHLARTVNGNDWQKESVATAGRALFSISSIAGNDLAVGQRGLMMRRMETGWSQVAVPSEERLFAVAQHPSGLAVACGSFGAVLVSTNSGRDWRKLTIDWMSLIEQPYEPHVYDVGIDAAGRIFIVGEFGMIARSDDRGESWTLLHSGDASLFGLEISRKGIGYAVGQSGALVKSSDGGDSWRELPTGSDAILLDVAIRDNGDALVSGIRQALFVPAAGDGITALDGDSLDTVWYSGVAVLNDAFYLVGENGRVIRISM